MKPLEKKTDYLEEFDVSVNNYLTYDQIQQIVDTLALLAKEKNSAGRNYDYWAARQQHIDMMVLLYATDIGAKRLEEIGHSDLVTCGLIEAVKNCINNYHQLLDAIKYSESWDKTLAKIVDSFTNVLENNKYNLIKLAELAKGVSDGTESD